MSAATGVISFALYLPCLFREFSVNPLRTAAASEGARKAAVLNRQVSRRSLKNQKPKELLKQYSRISIVNGTKFALDDEDDDLESRMSFRGMSFWGKIISQKIHKNSQKFTKIFTEFMVLNLGFFFRGQEAGRSGHHGLHLHILCRPLKLCSDRDVSTPA